MKSSATVNDRYGGIQKILYNITLIYRPSSICFLTSPANRKYLIRERDKLNNIKSPAGPDGI